MGLIPARPAADSPGPNTDSPGPDTTLAEVFRATSAEVWRLHAHLIGPEDADDLVQETYLRVLRALPGFRGESSVRFWVLSIAHRVAADEIRRRQRGRRLIGRLSVRQDDVPDPAGDHALIDLISRLEPARREAFVLTQVLELPYDEAARLAGCPVGTIRSRVARARGDLLAAYQADPGNCWAAGN